MRWAHAAAKRAIDIAGATAVLCASAPVMVGVAALVRVGVGGPVIYRQMRPGLHGKPFRLIKFRTMTDARGPDGKLLPDAQRLTSVGRFVRRWSLDELPQFVNVLVGDMSLVGPRPLLLRYLDRYTPRQALRMTVKPGITGWVAVNGRNAVDWETRFELDAWYAEHQSLWLDLKIMAMTARSVLVSSGVKAGAGAELEEFWGTAGRPEGDVFAFPVEENELVTMSSPPGGRRA